MKVQVYIKSIVYPVVDGENMPFIVMNVFFIHARPLVGPGVHSSYIRLERGVEMLKKWIIAIVMCVIFLVFPIYADEDVQHKKTERRIFTELCELYIYRGFTYKSYLSTDFEVRPKQQTIGTIEMSEDIIHIPCSAGSANIYKDDFTVSELSMTLSSYDVSSKTNDPMYDECILAISALEVSVDEDNTLPIMSRINGDPENAVEKAAIIFNYGIMPNVTEGSIRNAKDNGEVLLYSGNYDYYLQYFESDYGKEGTIYLFLKAKERK